MVGWLSGSGGCLIHVDRLPVEWRRLRRCVLYKVVKHRHEMESVAAFGMVWRCFVRFCFRWLLGVDLPVPMTY